MTSRLPDFWFLARCTAPGCDWQYRTWSKADFDKHVRDHRAGHK